MIAGQKGMQLQDRKVYNWRTERFTIIGQKGYSKTEQYTIAGHKGIP